MTIYRAQRCPEHERRGIPAGRPHSRQKLLCYSGRTFPDQQPNIQKPKRAIETETKSGGAIEKPMDEIGTDLFDTIGKRWLREKFKEFCKANTIRHELASAHNQDSNCLAEAAVKNLKAIVTRTNFFHFAP